MGHYLGWEIEGKEHSLDAFLNSAREYPAVMEKYRAEFLFQKGEVLLFVEIF